MGVGFGEEWMCSVIQSCLTLCDPMDCSLSGSSIHGILQARILEWIAIPFSRGSSQPRDWIDPWSVLQDDFLLSEPPGKPLELVWGMGLGASHALGISLSEKHLLF